MSLPVDAIEQPEEWKPLPGDFVDAVGVVAGCVSGDDSQFVLTCVHVHPEWLEACDNYQLCRYPLVTGIKEPTLIRGESLRYVVGLDAVEFAETKGWVHFRNATGTVLSCRRWVERFPSLDDLLKVQGTRTVLPKGLVEAVAKAEIFSGEDVVANRVTVELRDNRLKVEGRGPSGWYAEQKKLEYGGEPMRFVTLPKMLVELAKRGNECEVAEGKLKVDGGKWTYVTATSAPGD